MKRCKHSQIEPLYYDSDGHVTWCCSYCSMIIEDRELWYEQKEIERQIDNLCNIKGKRLA